MQANFKPKLWTKKEWRDNRSSATKNSGVGGALDAWQKNCPKEIDKMNETKVESALKTAKVLLSALDVAAKKCNKTRQKETLAGIGAYKNKVNEYMGLLKAAEKVLKKRKKITESLSFSVVTKNKELFKVFSDFAQNKGLIWPQLHTWIMINNKEYHKAVKLYGQGDGYNVGYRTSELLLKYFGAGANPNDYDSKKADAAIESLYRELGSMLRSMEHYVDLGKYDAYLKFLDRKFPMPQNFRV